MAKPAMKPARLPSTFFQLLVAIGIVMIVCGLFWTQLADPKSNWTVEQAKKFAEASAAYHAAAHSHQGEMGDNENLSLRVAQDRYHQIKQQLDTARSGPAIKGYWLKVWGAGLAILGLIGLFKNPYARET